MAETAKSIAKDDGRICEMGAKREATIDDLWHVEGKAELVNGELVLMSATGRRHGRAALRNASSLLEYEKRTGHGHALPDNVGFIVNLPHRRSFSPDAAYALQTTGEGFVDGAPVFAVEVRSPDDFGSAAERAMADKRADYFAAGTLVVWDVDTLMDHVVRAYRASDPGGPTIFRRGDRADAEPAVPGWSMPVDDLFPR
jgi:Uma2 family endonuclease